MLINLAGVLGGGGGEGDKGAGGVRCFSKSRCEHTHIVMVRYSGQAQYYIRCQLKVGFLHVYSLMFSVSIIISRGIRAHTYTLH